jgi:hypothetical protein
MERSNADQSRSRIRPGLILVVMAIFGLLIAGKLLGWFGSGQKPGATAEAGAPTTEGGTPATPEPAAPAVAPGRRAARTTDNSANAVAPPGGVTQPPVLSAVPVQPGAVPGERLKAGEWEQRLDDILGANDEEAQKATKLLEMFPLLPEDGQVEVAQHLSNLLPDDRYPALSQTFTNATTPEAVLEVLMTDVLNRPNGIKLPTLLQVARTPDHPKAGEAREVLEVFVDEDYGTDWAKWEKATQDWLKENPDEPPDDVGK